MALFGNLAYKSGVVLSTAVLLRFITALYFQCQKFLSPKKDKIYHAKIMMRTMSFLFFLWWLQDGMPLNGLIGNGLIDNGLVE